MATTTATLTPKKEKEATLPFRKLAALGSGGSGVNAADKLDELIKAGYSLKRDDVIGFATEPRRFKNGGPGGVEVVRVAAHEMDLALKSLEGGASKVKAAKNSWFPNAKSVNAFLKYFKEDKDTNASDKLSEIVKKITERLLNGVPEQ
ncbi:hypothetical protein Ancab_000546 [Ancistrocladus abbreviatus]